MQMLSSESKATSRYASIMGDSAYAIFQKNAKECTGNFFIDEEVLMKEGIQDFTPYAIDPSRELTLDFFLPDKYYEGKEQLFDLEKKDTDQSASANVEKVFKKFESLVTDQVKNELNSLLEFSISGKSWFMNAKSGEPLKVTNENIGEPNVSLITDNDTFMKMITGKMPSTSAYMQGKLKIKGNLSVALKLEKLFKNARQNL